MAAIEVISDVTRKRNEILRNITSEDFKQLEQHIGGEEYPTQLMEAVHGFYKGLDFIAQVGIMDGFDLGVKYTLGLMEKQKNG